MLGLSIGVAELAVIPPENADFPHFPAGFVLLLDDEATQIETPLLLEDYGAALIEEI